jgi:hypothetical protein
VLAGGRRLRYLARPFAFFEAAMFIMLSKKPRKSNRGKTARFRSKLKSKNAGRRERLFAWKTKKKPSGKGRK